MPVNVPSGNLVIDPRDIRGGLAMMRRRSKPNRASRDVLLKFDDGNYTCASPRFVRDVLNNPDSLIGPFAGGTPAIVRSGGRNFLQSESAALQECIRTEELNNWPNASLNSTTTADDETAPDGNATAEKLEMDADDAASKSFTIAQGDVSELWSAQLWAQAVTGSVGNTFRFAMNGAAGFSIKMDRALTVAWKFFTESDNIKAANVTVYYRHKVDVPDIGDPALPAYDAHVWGHQTEFNPWPTSYIKNSGDGTVTRAKDEFYWDSSIIPVAVRARKWAFKWAPYYASDDDGTARIIWKQDGIQDTIRRVGNRLQIRANNVQKVESNILTFSRYQLLTVIVDAVAGTVEVRGATGGNGKVTGSAWTWASGAGNHLRIHNQAEGLVSEPYAS